MRSAISNTSPLLYLYRADLIGWLAELFGEVWAPEAVLMELRVGHDKGYDVPQLATYDWLKVIQPKAVPSEWLVLDLGKGELETMALALENPDQVVLLDDSLAREIAKAAGLEVWGTLRVLLEAKAKGLTDSVQPLVERLEASGMWMSGAVKRRVLRLAGE